MQNNAESKYLHFVDFKKIDKWYVSYYINPYTIESNYPLVKLGEIIKPIKIKITKKQYDGSLDIVSKISFSDGKIYLRPERKTGMDLYLLNYGDLLVSKINFHQGALAINNISDLVCSTHYQPYDIFNKNISNQYLIMTLRAKKFQAFLAYLRADGIKNEATYDFIKDLQIPLPSLEIQKALVEAYQNKFNKADKLEQEATNLEEQIDTFILKELGVNLREVKKRKSGKLYFAEFNELFNWVHSADEATFFEDLQDAKYPVTELGLEFDFISRPWKKKEESKEYIELGGIDPNFGVMKTKTVYAKKAPSRATQTVKTGDLIIGTTRPYLKKFAIIQDKNNGDVASSGFSTIQENKDKYNLYFLNEILKSPIGIKQFEIKMTGALYPAITQADLLELKIPLPPLEIQREIADDIQQMKDSQKDKFEQAQQLKKQALLDFENAIFKPAE